MPSLLGYSCTSVTALSTHFDQEVIKLLSPQILSTSTMPVLPSLLTDTSLLLSTDVFYVQNLALSPPLNLPTSPYPIPVQDDSNIPQLYYSFEDFCYMLHFERVFYVNAEDSDDELGQWCLGAYKHVDWKVKLVPGRYPEDARVYRQFPENPLNSLTPLTPLPPDFIPTKKLTKERLALIKLNPDGFLWPEEEKLFVHVMKLNEAALVFDKSECGNFAQTTSPLTSSRSCPMSHGSTTTYPSLLAFVNVLSSCLETRSQLDSMNLHSHHTPPSGFVL